MQLVDITKEVCACVCPCGSLCGFVGVEGKQWQPLLQSHGYLELTWHFSCAFFRIIISQRPDIYLRPHRGASHWSQGQIFHDFFFSSFLVFREKQRAESVRGPLYLCQCLTRNFTVNPQPPRSYSFVISFCLLVCGILQELVRLCGDAHRELRDGGWGGDVHQTRLSALYLGPMSKSCVSTYYSLPHCFIFPLTLLSAFRICI